jgi:hypothetical protein
MKLYTQALARHQSVNGDPVLTIATVMLMRQGLAVNTKRVRRLMHELDIAVAAPKRKLRTTDSEGAYPRFRNLVEGLEVTRSEQVWVGSIRHGDARYPSSRPEPSVIYTS